MPIKSRAQQGYLFSNMPAMAHRWAKETPNMKDLPQRVRKSSVAHKSNKRKG